MVFNILLFLVNILILAIIYILLRRRIDKLTDTERLTGTIAGDLDLILSEINQATERNVLIIEDKITVLEEIIEKAEKRITMLKKHAQNDVETKKLKVPIPHQKETPKVEQELNELTYTHLNKMQLMSEMVTPLTVAEKTRPKEDSVREKVIALYKNGIDASIIASNVGINRGEVELIISLYKQINGGHD